MRRATLKCSLTLREVRTVDSKGAFQYFPDSILRNVASSVAFRGIRNTVGISSEVFELGRHRLERFDLFRRKRADEVQDPGSLVIDRQRGVIRSLSRSSQILAAVFIGWPE